MIAKEALRCFSGQNESVVLSVLVLLLGQERFGLLPQDLPEHRHRHRVFLAHSAAFAGGPLGIPPVIGEVGDGPPSRAQEVDVGPHWHRCGRGRSCCRGLSRHVPSHGSEVCPVFLASP